jgi:ribosomal protein S21
VTVVSEDGRVDVATRNFREASKAGKHSSAVERYVDTGDDSALRRFRGKYIIDAQGNRIVLLTDLDELDRLGSAGELSFESLYPRGQ